MDLHRRHLLSGAAASIAASAIATRAFAQANPTAAPLSAGAPRYVDIHHHVCPTPLAAAMKREGRGQITTLQQCLDEMEKSGTQLAVNTCASPVDYTHSRGEAQKLIRDCNDYMARMRSDYPGRFAVFAMLPLTNDDPANKENIDACLKEIEYAYDTLKVEGVHFFTSAGEIFVGDPVLNPIMDELNRRKAVIKTHPAVNPCCELDPLKKFGGTGISELGNDTQRAISVWLYSGAAQKYRDVKLIWSHAGGSLLGQLQRYHGDHVDEKWKAVLPQGANAELKRMYYDTAQAYHPATLMALKALVPNDHILFGTDWPFLTAAQTAEGIEAAKVFSKDEWAAIKGPNARKLLNLPG